MSGNTPLDGETGIPLPIAPRSDLPPIPRGKQVNIERIADWHHPFHPRSRLVNQGLGNAAIRNCRVQWTTYEDHHDKYHGAFDGPQLPQAEADKFRTVVFAAAGYVPEQGLAFTDAGKPLFVRLSESERSGLWRRKEIKVANDESVRDFMVSYVLRHEFAGIRSSTIDEFMSTQNIQRRKEIGSSLLSIAAHDATQDVAGMYRYSRERQLLPPDRAATAGRFVLSTMRARGSSRVFDALRSRLAG